MTTPVSTVLLTTYGALARCREDWSGTHAWPALSRGSGAVVGDSFGFFPGTPSSTPTWLSPELSTLTEASFLLGSLSLLSNIGVMYFSRHCSPDTRNVYITLDLSEFLSDSLCRWKWGLLCPVAGHIAENPYIFYDRMNRIS